MERESSLSPAAAAVPDHKPAATAASQAEPEEKPKSLPDGPTPGGGLRLFVVHAPEDAWFVEGFLLEALRLPEGDVLVSSQLEPGAVIVNEIERGALSPVAVVVVVSPAFLASPWAQFANQLAMHQSIETASDGSATLVPAILADCELPLLSRFRVPRRSRPGATCWRGPRTSCSTACITASTSTSRCTWRRIRCSSRAASTGHADRNRSST